MRGLLMSGFMALVISAVDAEAGLARQCRTLCKTAIAYCVGTTGQSRRACRRALVPRCKREGLEVCALSVTTPTTPDDGATTTTTTTTPPPTSGAGGVMSVQTGDITFAGDADPRLYTIPITIKYSVVTVGAATSVTLDPAHFSVLDEDTGIVYPAEPAAAPEDCSADDVVTRDGPAVTCTLHVAMPLSVGDYSVENGGSHAKLQFESNGLHGSDRWSL